MLFRALCVGDYFYELSKRPGRLLRIDNPKGHLIIPIPWDGCDGWMHIRPGNQTPALRLVVVYIRFFIIKTCFQFGIVLVKL